MTRRNFARPLAWTACIVAGLALGYSPELLAKAEPLPEVSPEGLHLKHDSKGARVVYVKPGATLEQYKRVAILDCYVEFDKDWQRDYNSNTMGIQGRVTTADMDRMKAAVSAEFKKVFTKELQEKGGYQVVDTAAPDVLVLRPAIINLIVTAPDLQTANMSRSVVSSAGQMTLYLELWDSATNTILARILDPQADHAMGGMAQVSSSVSNAAAADRIFRGWAEKLRNGLDSVRGKAAGP
jgi:hypothetical protein